MLLENMADFLFPCGSFVFINHLFVNVKYAFDYNYNHIINIGVIAYHQSVRINLDEPIPLKCRKVRDYTNIL